MKKKGFTLIEMLAVVIIICLLTLLVLPNITNSVKNFNDDTDDMTFSMMTSAAQLYIDDNQGNFSKYSENEYCIRIDELVEGGYLRGNIQYNGEDIDWQKVFEFKRKYREEHNTTLTEAKLVVRQMWINIKNKTLWNFY